MFPPDFYAISKELRSGDREIFSPGGQGFPGCKERSLEMTLDGEVVAKVYQALSQIQKPASTFDGSFTNQKKQDAR
jgi:hypothetical protein